MFILIKSSLAIISFRDHAFGVVSKMSSPNLGSPRLSPVSSHASGFHGHHHHPLLTQLASLPLLTCVLSFFRLVELALCQKGGSPEEPGLEWHLVKLLASDWELVQPSCAAEEWDPGPGQCTDHNTGLATPAASAFLPGTGTQTTLIFEMSDPDKAGTVSQPVIHSPGGAAHRCWRESRQAGAVRRDPERNVDFMASLGAYPLCFLPKVHGTLMLPVPLAL